VRPQPPSIASPPRSFAVPEQLDSPARTPRIWLVDDSPTERQFTRRSLGNAYAFEEFDDGSEVVERLARTTGHPDLILLDWVMPGMSGDEVCRFLRSHARTRDLPIILLTASRVETGDVVAGLASGANDYIARPFVAEELRARVDSAVRTKQALDAAARERKRLAAINGLGSKLFDAGTDVSQILERLGHALSEISDGCSIMLLPGLVEDFTFLRHATGGDLELSGIGSFADPAAHQFADDSHALATLPPQYHAYIRRHGLRSLVILPFPILTPVQGIVTTTRDRASEPFDADDIAAIETCIEYAALAVQSALRFEAERTARGQLHAVLEHAPVGIVATSATGAITFANPAASRLIPGIADAPDLASLYELARWERPTGEPVTRSDWGATPVTEPRRTELVMTAPDGSASRMLAMSTVPLGVPGGSITTIEDVSAERAIAAERERVALFQEQMLAIVGHDLRTPIGAVVAGVDLLEALLAELERPDVANVIKRVRGSAHRMTNIVDQLLDVTRARLGDGIPIARWRCALVPVVQGVLDELTLAHPRARFELVATTDVEGEWDADRLSQVVSNLASNAAQYGRPDAPVRVEVSASEHEAAIVVANQIREEPIPPERLGSLFEPYKRGGGRQHHSQGLGLGLYIAREIVRAHRGTIAAVSSASGTQFRITLPRSAPPR
jgi:phosphoserine phosphatase RsbU/P